MLLNIDALVKTLLLNVINERCKRKKIFSTQTGMNGCQRHGNTKQTINCPLPRISKPIVLI